MERNATQDYARLIAAFGIVFFHAGAPGSTIGYAALPFFLMLMVVMAMPNAKGMAFLPYMSGRAQRLLMPWLTWSALYAALKLVEAGMKGMPLWSEFSLHMLFTGPALHLWFLPFAFVACLLAHPVSRWGKCFAPEILAISLLGAGIICFLLRQGQSWPVPFAQWHYAMPAVFLGFAMAFLAKQPVWQGAILAAFVVAAVVNNANSGLLQITLAGAALILCRLYHTPGTALAKMAGDAALGVYLAHPLILSLLERATPLKSGDISFALGGCLGALAVSLGIIWLKTGSIQVPGLSAASFRNKPA